MSSLSGLPSEVPGQYRVQLEKFQKQIKILLQNHQILVSRSEKDPKNERILKQISDVKRYLVSFSEQQRAVVDKVRTFLKESKLGPKKPHLGPPPVPPLQTVNRQVQHQREQIIDHSSKAGLPLKATKIKKGKKKARKKSSDSSKSPTPHDSGDEDGLDERFLSYFKTTEGTCRGHVEDYESHYPPVEEDTDSGDYNSDEEVIFARVDKTVDQIEKENYMLNIDLLNADQFRMVSSHQEDKRSRKAKKRINTYIPEISDKKYRYRSFLQNSITSPPHLRRRKPGQISKVPRPVKSLSAPSAIKALNLDPPVKSDPIVDTTTVDEGRVDSPGLLRAQLDGSHDPSERKEVPGISSNKMSNESVKEDVNQSYDHDARLAERNRLLKVREEMEEELGRLKTRSKTLRENLEKQKEKKNEMLRKEAETRENVEIMHNLLSDVEKGCPGS